MPKPIDGTDNVYVLGVKDKNEVIPARTNEEMDNMLEESLAIQKTQVDDFIADLTRMGDRPEIYNYGSLMQHLQSECVVHLSAYGAAATLVVWELRKQLAEVDQALMECESKLNEGR